MAEADLHLDITDEVCPMTFVRAKLAIEKMAGTAKNSVDAGRMQSLADILKQPVR